MIKKIQDDGLSASKNISRDAVQLSEHVQDAQLMLTYASEEGLHIDHAIITDIVHSRHCLINKTFDQEKEIIFWNAFNALSQKIQPVSISSIKATKVRKGIFKKSDAAWTVFVYQGLTLLVLITLLLIQIYWLVGSITIAQVAKSQSFQEEIKRLSDLTKTQVELSKYIQKNYCERIGELFDKYEDKQNDVKVDARMHYQIIEIWYIPISFLARWIGKIFSVNSNNPLYIIKSPDDDSYLRYIKIRQSVQLILQPIQEYILPLLYGWIGALAYVLRSINREIKQITYTHQSKEHYRLRAQLGALSGLAVGWFISVDPEYYTTNSSFSFGNLSPLALSFLAGYSVELLFSAMDKIVEAFSAKPTPPQASR